MRFTIKILLLFFLITKSALCDNQTIRIGTTALAPSLGNPYKYTGHPHLYTFSATFDGLTRFDKNGRLNPWLAISWENKTPLTWEITLRENVYFSSGRHLNADAVISTIKYLISKEGATEPVATQFSFIRDAEKINNKKLKIHTFTPSPFLPRTLPLLHIVDPYQWKTLGPIGFSQIPIGTGPFQPIKYSSNKIILKAFKNSWRKPNIENIEIIAVPDAYTRTLGLVSDQLDIALSIGPDEITFIENSGGKGVAWLSADLWSINFHHKKGTPMDNIKVREALNLAINRKELIDGLLNGVPEIPSQPAPRNAYGFNDKLDPIKYDPERAKALLANAGFPDGFSFVLEGAIGVGANDSAMYQKVAQDLSMIGVKMKIQPIPVSQLIRNVIEGGWEGDAFGLNYTSLPTLDVLKSMRNHSCLWPNAWYCNEKIMPYINEARVTFDKKKSLELRQKIMDFYRNQWVSIFLYQAVRFAGIKKNLKGFSEVHNFIPYEDMYFMN